MRGEDRDAGGKHDQHREREHRHAAGGAAGESPAPRPGRAPCTPDGRDPEHDQHRAGERRQDSGEVVPGDAVDGDVSDAVRYTTDDRERAGEDRRPPAHLGAEPRCDHDQQTGGRQGDEPAGEVIAGRDTRLGMDEGIIRNGERDDDERGPEDGDAVAGDRRGARPHRSGRARVLADDWVAQVNDL